MSAGLVGRICESPTCPKMDTLLFNTEARVIRMKEEERAGFTPKTTTAALLCHDYLHSGLNIYGYSVMSDTTVPVNIIVILLVLGRLVTVSAEWSIGQSRLFTFMSLTIAWNRPPRAPHSFSTVSMFAKSTILHNLVARTECALTTPRRKERYSQKSSSDAPWSSSCPDSNERMRRGEKKVWKMLARRERTGAAVSTRQRGEGLRVERSLSACLWVSQAEQRRADGTGSTTLILAQPALRGVAATRVDAAQQRRGIAMRVYVPGPLPALPHACARSYRQAVIGAEAVGSAVREEQPVIRSMQASQKRRLGNCGRAVTWSQARSGTGLYAQYIDQQNENCEGL